MDKKSAGFDQVFRALGDVHRLEILDLLMERERNAGELLEAVNVVQSTLSHHMKRLCESGLVTARKAGRWTYYSVSQERAREAQEFLTRYLGAAPPIPDAGETVRKSEKKKDKAEKPKKEKKKDEKRDEKKRGKKQKKNGKK